MAVADGDGRLSMEERGLWGVRCSPVSPVWLLHWWTHKRLQRPGSSLLQMTSSAAQGGAGALLYCEDSISGPLGRTAQRSARAGLGRRAWIRIKETKGIPGLRGPWQTCWAWSSPLVWQAVGPGAALAPGVVLAPTHAILTFGDLFPSVHGAGRSCSELLFSHFKHKVTHFFVVCHATWPVILVLQAGIESGPSAVKVLATGTPRNSLSLTPWLVFRLILITNIHLITITKRRAPS